MTMVRASSKSSQRLAELTRLVREVDSAPDLESALSVLVGRTREIMRVDVCTVYFTDENDRRHVIAATDGLSSRVVGNVHCQFGQGLIGRIAENRRPLNLEQVPPELDRDFLLQTGAERYQGFLGVPVVHKTRVQKGYCWCDSARPVASTRCRTPIYVNARRISVHWGDVS